MKKICLISGGAFGIGFSIAKKLSSSNYHVIIADNNKKKLLQCKKNFKTGSFFYCDISQEKSILNLKKAIVNEFGCYPTLLINNAAIVRFGDIFYEIVKLIEPKLLFGQPESRFEIQAECIRAREGLFNAE